MHPPKGTPEYEEWRSRQSVSQQGKQPWNKGKKHTPETRTKISANVKSAMTEERKAQMSITRKGRPNPKNSRPLSEEHKAKLIASHKGKPAWNRNIPMAEEMKAHLSSVRKGRKPSDATKDKMSESHKARYANGYSMPENARKKVGDTHRGKIVSEETRTKQSVTRKGRPGTRTGIPQPPETVKRMSQISRQQWENMSEEQKAAKLEILRASTKDITKSLLEEVVAAELDTQGIVYERQKRIGWYRVDFYIPIQNLIIEAQGCFWHACEQCGEELHQEKRDADAKRHEYLQRKGYQLKIIWEHERKSELRALRKAQGNSGGNNVEGR